MKTISKKILKTGYYWEIKPFYDNLPSKLPIPKKYFEKVNTGWTTEEEMIKGNKPFTKEEAFGLICKFIQDKKYGVNIVWFKDNDALCEVSVRLVGGGWDVYAIKFRPSRGWDAGFRSFFRNANLDTLTSDPSETLTLENFISDLKDIIKKYE